MTYNYKIFILLALTVLLIAAGANYGLNLGILPRFARLMFALAGLATLAFVMRFGPTRKEIEEHRRKKAEGRR